MVARAFETWIHGIDIASALGRAMPTPRAEHLHTMADLGVRSLPASLALTHGESPEGSARVVLAGDGGGDWTIRLGSDSPEPVVTLALDVLEFCFVAAERLPPHGATTTIEGDVPLGRRRPPSPARKNALRPSRRDEESVPSFWTTPSRPVLRPAIGFCRCRVVASRA
ncbi:hypothetical protein [Spirillospora sp. CA-294931]|uniref:hypothetical protein n=1 Tax=Spirillospora sp. CA-294931 TaxID=3240042 RepID=UPI003D8FBACB